MRIRRVGKRLFLFPFMYTNRRWQDRRLADCMSREVSGVDDEFDYHNPPDSIYQGVLWIPLDSDTSDPSIDQVVRLVDHLAGQVGIAGVSRTLHLLPGEFIEQCIVDSTNLRVVDALLRSHGRGALWWALLLDGSSGLDVGGNKIPYPPPEWKDRLSPLGAITEFLLVLHSGVLEWRYDSVPASDAEMLSFLTKLPKWQVIKLNKYVCNYLAAWRHLKSLDYVVSRKNLVEVAWVDKASLPEDELDRFPRLKAVAMFAGRLSLDTCHLDKASLKELSRIYSSDRRVPNSNSLCYRPRSILSNAYLPDHIDFLVNEFETIGGPELAGLDLARTVLLGGPVQKDQISRLPAGQAGRASRYWVPPDASYASDLAVLSLLYRPDIQPSSKGQLLDVLSTNSRLLEYFLSCSKLRSKTSVQNTGSVIIDSKSLAKIIRRKEAMVLLSDWLKSAQVDLIVEGADKFVPVLVSRRMCCSSSAVRAIDYWISQLTKKRESEEGEG